MLWHPFTSLSVPPAHHTEVMELRLVEHWSFPGLNPAAVYHPGRSCWGLCTQEEREDSVSLPSAAFILPAVDFRAGPVDDAGLRSKCQHGTSGADKHLLAVNCKLVGTKTMTDELTCLLWFRWFNAKLHCFPYVQWFSALYFSSNLPSRSPVQQRAKNPFRM